MNELMKTMLMLSASGTFLICILFMFRPLYRKRISWNWQYYVWLIVAARLLFPWTLEISPLETVFESSYENSWGQESQPEAEETTKKQTDTVQNEAGIKPASIQIPEPLQSGIPFILPRLHYPWILVALLLFVRKITLYQSFVKYIEAGSAAVDDIGCLEELGILIKQKKIRKTIGLYTSSLVSSPLLVGFFHPRIVIPEAVISGSDFHYTLLHELVHEKRKDLLYKWLLQIVVCLHWFNPFVYLMEHEISRLCELSCDESVIRHLDVAGQRAYGNTLLNVAGTGSLIKNPVASVSLGESRKLLKGRLEAIMKYRKKSKLSKAAAFVLTIIFALTASITGVYQTPVKAENIQSSKTQQDGIKIRYEDGVYYIVGKGVPESEKPSCSVTDGAVMLVFVEKDHYVSLGPFENLAKLSDEVREECAKMKKENRCTQPEMDVILDAAKEIQNAYDASGRAKYIALNKESITLKKGKQTTLKLKGTKKKITWLSGNKKIASVSKKGKVTAKKAGIASITAAVGRITWTCKVKVTESGKVPVKEYSEIGIEKKNGAYYYQNRRIRLFMDVRADDSFVLFNYDQKGTIDLCVKRDEKNYIIGIWWIPKKEADEIIKDHQA